MSDILAVDASVAMSWCFPDEADGYAYAVLDALPDSTAMAPSLWPVELANALAMAERRKRITWSDATRFLALIAALPIDIHSETSARALDYVLPLARTFSLTAYEATYLISRCARGSRWQHWILNCGKQRARQESESFRRLHSSHCKGVRTIRRRAFVPLYR